MAPYEPRLFPLPDSVFEQLLEEMPPEEAEEDGPVKQEDTVASAVAAVASGIYDQSRPATPVTFVSESVDSLSPADEAEDLEVDEMEDPNDPEWEGSQGSAPRSRKR